jgi:hypothetical protein
MASNKHTPKETIAAIIVEYVNNPNLSMESIAANHGVSVHMATYFITTYWFGSYKNRGIIVRQSKINDDDKNLESTDRAVTKNER